MRFSYSVRGMATGGERAAGLGARGSKRAWIEMADITRRSRRRDRMIDARQLRRSCVARIATVFLYARAACDYYSNFHDSERPRASSGQCRLPTEIAPSEYLLSALLFVNRCLAPPPAHRATGYAPLRRLIIAHFSRFCSSRRAGSISSFLVNDMSGLRM